MYSYSWIYYTFFNILLFVRWVMFCVCMEILYQEQIFIFSPSRGKSTSRYIINDFPKDRKRKSILHYTFRIFGFESAGQKMSNPTPVFKFQNSKWYIYPRFNWFEPCEFFLPTNHSFIPWDSKTLILVFSGP